MLSGESFLLRLFQPPPGFLSPALAAFNFLGSFSVVITTGTCLAVNATVGFIAGWAIAALLIWGVFKLESQTNC